MPGMDPVSVGLGVLGAGGSFFAGRSAAKAQKELLRRQRDFADVQLGMARQAQPFYGQLLQQYAQRAGLGSAPGLQQMGEGHYQALPRGQFGLGGNYGSYEDQLRLRAAEDDINRQSRMGANALRFQLGQRGVANASIGAALARNQSAADQAYGGFRRGLAINAGQEQQQRLGQLAQILGIGLGQGSAGAGILGQQAGVYGQQSAAANAGLGNILQNFMYMNALDRYGQQPVLGGVTPTGLPGFVNRPYLGDVNQQRLAFGNNF